MTTVEALAREGAEKRVARVRAMDLQFREMQRDRLLSVLRQNEGTEFGRSHGFASIRTVADFQRAIPISAAADYEAAWNRIAEGASNVLFSDPVHAFGLSSGTTGEAKLIPLAKGLLRGLKHAIGYATCCAMARTGNWSLLRGYALQMAAPTCVRRLLGSIPVGYITGIIGASRSYPFHNIGIPPIDVLDRMDWAEKYRIVEERYSDHDVRMIFGVPNYIHGLLRHILAGRRRPLWPDLSLVVTSGTSLAPHREAFAQVFPKAEFREMYLATEAAVGFQPAPEPGLMAVAEDVFLEFVPEEAYGAAPGAPGTTAPPPAPPRFLLGEAEPGVAYVPIVTTPSGLYAYSLGDVVRFLERDPPRFEVVGRLGNVINLATEKLEAGQAERAVREADLRCAAFLVCPLAPPEIGHEWVVEFRGVPPADAAERIDLALRRINPLYRHLREGGGLLAAPHVTAVAADAFARALLRRPGQGKILAIYNDRAIRDELVAEGPA